LDAIQAPAFSCAGLNDRKDSIKVWEEIINIHGSQAEEEMNDLGHIPGIARRQFFLSPQRTPALRVPLFRIHGLIVGPW
jgi:hypothetical protein